MQFNKIFLGSRSLNLNAFRSIRISAVNFDDNIEDKIEDPIQKLFLEKLREYKQKSSEGKMVDPTPEIEKELQSELERVNKQHGGDGKTDLTKFPDFKFPEVKIDPILSEEK